MDELTTFQDALTAQRVVRRIASGGVIKHHDLNDEGGDYDYPGSGFVIEGLSDEEGEALAKKVRPKTGFYGYWTTTRQREKILEIVPHDLDAPWDQWSGMDHTRVLRQIQRLL